MKSDHLRGLYVLTDQYLTPATTLLDQVAHAIGGGGRIVQYRDKSDDQQQRLQQARALNELCRKHNVIFIINDDVGLARQCGAHGVHLGQHDTDLQQARAELGDEAIIGVSCYNSLERAQLAQQQGANYVAFGSFFPSPIKPDAVRANPALLQQARQQLSIPVAAIGGIQADNAAELVNAGADMLAVISAVFAQQDITTAARALSSLYAVQANGKLK